ncbi:MAG TPA: extracellular solute-binding protein [Clostridiales bacterium]|nr:extracellular solute-binding protein [Clostridiales bacterium]
MKKVTALIILVCFITTSFISPSYAIEQPNNIQKLIFEYTLKENGYEAYLEKHRDKQRPDKEIIIEGGDYSYSQGDSFVLDSYEGVEGNLIQTSEKGYVEWKFNIEEAGLYNIEITYFPIEGRRSSIERQLLINGEVPFNEARLITFSRMFSDKTDIKQDNQGNDIRPSQVEKPNWNKFVLRDSERLFPEPLKFYFDKGVQTIRLVGIREPMIIQSIRIFNQEELQSYKDVSISYDIDPTVDDSYIQIIQAEDAYLKSDATLFPLFDRSSSKTEPFAYNQIKLNTIGGYNWRNSGQWLSWIISVPEDGYYKLAFKYRQNYSVGLPITRALYIDGNQYFKEMNQVEFYYGADWQMKTIGDDSEPFLFYLTKGDHEVKLEITLGAVSDIVRDTNQVAVDLYNLYTKIVMLTGAAPDYYRDYQLEKKLPDMLSILEENLFILREKIEELKLISQDNVNESSILEQLAFQLEDMIKEPDTIPRRIKNFRDNISNLSTWLLSVREIPLDLDYLVVASKDTKLPKVKMGFFESIIFHIVSFFTSFIVDYDTLGNIYEDDAITVWAMMNRDQANTLKALIDEEFTPQTGISVNLSLINNENIMLFSAASGTGPDVAINVSRYIPMDYGIRNALIDLSTLDGFEDMRKQFVDSAFVPYSYGDKVFGLPTTQTFPMLFVRTDIMANLGLEVPETWDELHKVIGILQENNLQFAPGYPYDCMILQSDSEYYSKDLTKVLLDSPEGIEVFKLWTNLYTQYGVDVHYDFFNRFRTGEMPIGIEDYTMYNMLVVAAPQIKGLWKMYLLPGTVKEDGTIDKTVAGNGTASIIFNSSQKTDQAWEFLKWWMSVDVQAKYGKEIEAILGTAARYNTAAVEAVGYLDWPQEEYEVLMEQWSYVEEIPYIPGSYYVGRNIGNAFNEVVINGENPRETIEKYVIEMNKEIEKKLNELIRK